MWTCAQTGDCCRETDEVVMTHAEQAEITRARPDIAASFLPHVDPAFVRLVAQPCPFYADGCTVYAVRPYSCRRFACLRTDPSASWDAVHQEPYRRADRRQLIVIQRHAQRWARSHGWNAV
jgi:hypothetical protein